MPNIVYNTVNIRGDRSVLDAIAAQVNTDEQVFDFAAIIPIPAEIRAEYEASKGQPSPPWPLWYTWNNANWGTKWNAVLPQMHDTGSALQFDFETAWGGAPAVVSALARQHPEAAISYSFGSYEWMFEAEERYRGGKLVMGRWQDLDEYYLEEMEQESAAIDTETVQSPPS